MDVLDLSRLQFALTIMFHYLFPPLTIGLGVILPPESCLAMWAGAMIFWWQGRKKPAPGTRAHAIWVDGYESICAGLISGAALVGIGNAIVNVLTG